jgi:mono/diheme cytochrome c family protein
LEKKFMRPFRVLVFTLIVATSIAYAASRSFAAAKKVDGAYIFVEKCSMCHGMDGKGYPFIKTPNFTDPKWHAAHPDKELLNAVEKGVTGTAMPSFKGKLSKEETTAVLKYIRSLGAPKKK